MSLLKNETWEQYQARQEKILAEYEKADKEAKEKGEIVGRIYREGVCDGSALYQVVKVTKRTAKLKHIDVYDGYRAGWVEQMGGTVPLKIVANYLRADDALSKIFGRK